MALPAGRRGIRANLVKSDGTIDGLDDIIQIQEDLAGVEEDIVEVNTALSNITKLLWSNEDPSVAFNSQTVNFSTTGFTYFIVVFRRVANLSQNVSAIGFLGQNTASTFPNDGNASYAHARGFTIYATGVTFADGYLNGSVDNTRMVPYQVYGCK